MIQILGPSGITDTEHRSRIGAGGGAHSVGLYYSAWCNRFPDVTVQYNAYCIVIDGGPSFVRMYRTRQIELLKP